MSVRAILIICTLTLREVLRRRLLWVLLALSVASVAFVGWTVTRTSCRTRASRA